MKPRILLVFGVAAAASVAGVLWWSAPADNGEELDDIVLDEDGVPIDAREQQRRRRGDLQAQARNLAFDARDREDGEPAVLRDPNDNGASAQFGTGSIDRRDAEAGFDHIMRVLEDTARDRERLDKADWRELYRAANDAYAALSMHLDANDPGDREALEQAHRRLQDGLRRVRVRGRKFGPD